MEMRRLGNSQFTVAPIAFGGNVLGWTADEAMSFRLLDAFVDAGFNLLDTADVYSRFAEGLQGGESETVIGKWMAQGGGRREKIVLATKCGNEMGPGKKGLSPAYIAEAVEASLKRLKTDCIDLYQAHRDDPDTPIADTLGAFQKLIEQGKVREIGASNYEAPRLKEALDLNAGQGLPRFQSLQPNYSLVERKAFEGPLEELCLAENVGVIGYFSLASGFLTGKYRKAEEVVGKPRERWLGKYMNEGGYKVLRALDDVAEKHGAKQAHVALAWLIARPSVTAPIASATNLDQMKDLALAAELRLDAEDIAKLDAASA